MEKNIEVLLSVMNIKNKEEFKEKIKENNIKSNVLAINQVNNIKYKFDYVEKNKCIYSYMERGASNSRNRLLENANGDICIFADDDVVFDNNYEEIIINEYDKNPDADIIVFYVKSMGKEREKNKKIENKKINSLDIMRVRAYEVALKKDTIEKIKKNNIKFDKNFGPTGIFKKGEETIFFSDLYRKKFKMYSSNKLIGIVRNDGESSWFKGFNKKYMFDQGAIFYRMNPKLYKLLILQYIIRKFSLYNKNMSMIQAYKYMLIGSIKCKKIYGEKSD